jgi:Zn ribbon nucleic-acid-binding protein
MASRSPRARSAIAASSRTTNGAGCPVCANQQIQKGFNDLATTHPEIAKQADGWDPSTIFAGTHTSKAWICNEGHRWQSIVHNRVNQNPESCPICSGKQVLFGFNDLETLHPEIAKLANGWDPKKFTSGSNKNVEWKCNLGHIWSTAIHSLTLQGTNCPTCSGQKLLSGFNDLATTHPELSKEVLGWDPKTIGRSSEANMEWKCPIGHVYSAVVYRRALRGDKCPICSGKQVLAGFNDLVTTNPHHAPQADGWDPKKYTAGSNAKVK